MRKEQSERGNEQWSKSSPRDLVLLAHVRVAAMIAASKLLHMSTESATAPLLPIIRSPAQRVKEGRERV